MKRGSPNASRHTDERRNGNRRFRLMAASLGGQPRRMGRMLPAGLPVHAGRPVKLTRMFAMALHCLTTEGGA